MTQDTRDAVINALIDQAQEATLLDKQRMEPEMRRITVQVAQARLHQIEQWEDRQRGRILATRIASGLCASLNDWCLTHNEEMNAGHAYDRGLISTLD